MINLKKDLRAIKSFNDKFGDPIQQIDGLIKQARALKRRTKKRLEQLQIIVKGSL